jgi:Fe-S cluster biogenesis protein NfuA
MLMIQDVELTPNPHALKFILNERLLNFETRQFNNRAEAEYDPFAKGIFEIQGVVSVFYMDKFVTVEKEKQVGWGQIQRPLVEFLKSFDKNLIPQESKDSANEVSDELLKQINEVIERSVKPALANDGGGLQIVGINGFTVKIHYQGACGSCPTAINGTLRAIEGLLKRDVHPSIEVVAA